MRKCRTYPEPCAYVRGFFYVFLVAGGKPQGVQRTRGIFGGKETAEDARGMGRKGTAGGAKDARFFKELASSPFGFAVLRGLGGD